MSKLLPALATIFFSSSLFLTACSVEGTVKTPDEAKEDNEPIDVDALCEDLAEASSACIPEGTIAKGECVEKIDGATDTCRAALFAAYSCIARDVDPKDETTCTAILDCPVSEMKEICEDDTAAGGAGGSGGVGGSVN